MSCSGAGEAELDTQPYEATPGGEAASGGTYGRFATIGVLGSGGMGVVLSAYDPKLDRKVAVKVLRPDRWGREPGGTERLWREAQAMAKLSHPNVIVVYEAGQAGGRAYLAMELVEGTTLRAWQAHERRWGESVEMYVGAGRGLEAAHAAGLVHRDFKPENVLIGRDGRPRVSDFGLAAAGARFDKADVEGAPTESGLSVGGALVGTPAYMAPEQWEGRAPDARSDQFSFCVALWEAVYESAPFERSGGAGGLRCAVLAGEVRAPAAARSRAPAWLEAVLRRGLERDPAKRWPSMATLLNELSRRPSRRRRLALALAAGATAVAAAGAATSTGAGVDPCPGDGASLVGVWGDARKAEVGAAFARTALPYAARTASIVGAAIDEQAGAWVSMRRQACRATREGRQSASMLARRLECLGRWRGEASALTSLWAREADAAAVELAASAVDGLPSIEGCGDLAALAERAPAPGDADSRRRFDDAAAAIGRAAALLAAGRPDQARADADLAVVAAEGAGDDSLRARARLLFGGAQWAAGDEQAARASALEAARLAARARDDALAVEAMTLLVDVIGADGAHAVEALATAELAEVPLLRAGDPARLRAPLLLRRARALQGRGRHDQARAVLGEAEVLAARGGVTPLGRFDLALQRVSLADAARDEAGARAAIERALPLAEAALGEDHPKAAGLRADARARREARR